MIANLLTAIRVLLIPPVALGLAGIIEVSGTLLSLLLLIAIASDFLDGKAARYYGTASSNGMLFDHGTDFLFVTSAMAGIAYSGLISPLLPVLITVAFSQYVIDSYFLYREKQLKMSMLGRWNGVFYFVPPVICALSLVAALNFASSFLQQLAVLVVWGLVVSTLLSILDRAFAPLRDGGQTQPPS